VWLFLLLNDDGNIILMVYEDVCDYDDDDGDDDGDGDEEEEEGVDHDHDAKERIMWCWAVLTVNGCNAQMP
jgi:hypothetical protein